MQQKLKEQHKEIQLQHCRDLLKLMGKFEREEQIEDNDNKSLEGLQELQVDDEQSSVHLEEQDFDEFDQSNDNTHTIVINNECESNNNDDQSSYQNDNNLHEQFAYVNQSPAVSNIHENDSPSGFTGADASTGLASIVNHREQW